jgi:hypothetical protein
MTYRVFVLFSILGIPASALAGSCPDLSGSYEITPKSHCHYEHERGDKTHTQIIGGDDFPELEGNYFTAHTRVDVKQNGCDSAEFTFTETDRPDLRPMTNTLYFRQTFYEQGKVSYKFGASSIEMSAHTASASSNRGQAIPVPTAGAGHWDWKLAKEKDGSLKMSSAGISGGFFFVIPYVKFYAHHCTLQPVR